MKATFVIGCIALSYFLHNYIIFYEIYIAAGGFILYYLVKSILRLRHRSYLILDACAFTFLVSVLVLTTGGITSPFFFLIYFLVCAIALLIDWPTALAASLGYICFFIFSLPVGSIAGHLIPLGSIALLTPFAILLGQEHHKLLQEENKIHQMEKIQAYLENENSKEKNDTILFVLTPIKMKLQSAIDMLRKDPTTGSQDVIANTLMSILKHIEQYETNKSKD